MIELVIDERFGKVTKKSDEDLDSGVGKNIRG